VSGVLGVCRLMSLTAICVAWPGGAIQQTQRAVRWVALHAGSSTSEHATQLADNCPSSLRRSVEQAVQEVVEVLQPGPLGVRCDSRW
jgi:hypothetical protein